MTETKDFERWAYNTGNGEPVRFTVPIIQIPLGGNMKTPEIFGMIFKFLPSLVSLAEGIFSWKEKSGADKKAFVTTTLKTVVDGVTENSTGGQKKTWSDFAPAIDMAIDAAVEIANTAGAFEDSFSNMESMTKVAD